MTVSFHKALYAYGYNKHSIQSILTGRMFTPSLTCNYWTDEEREGQWLIFDVVDVKVTSQVEVIE